MYNSYQLCLHIPGVYMEYTSECMISWSKDFLSVKSHTSHAPDFLCDM